MENETGVFRKTPNKRLDMKTYFSFSLEDSMFLGSCNINRQVLSVEEVAKIINNGVEFCYNSHYLPLIKAIHSRFGKINIPLKEVPLNQFPNKIILAPGDSVIVVSSNLPCLPRGLEYNEKQTESATFTFTMYTVV